MDMHPDTPDLLIRNGRVLDPATGRDERADVLVRDGRIESIESRCDVEGMQELDATDCLVVPGLVDPHVHLREPGGEAKETIASGTKAALAGGFTTVCCMPNTTPALDSPRALDFVHLKAAESAACRVFVVAAATIGRLGEQIAPIDSLIRAGAVGISDDGDVVASPRMMQQVLACCARHDTIFMQHAQEPTLTEGASMNSGPTASKLGLRGWPAIAEELIVERDIRILAETGGRYHVQHVSSGTTVDLIRKARATGLQVSGEASPHHLLLDDRACDGYDTMAKMNPPLRTEADVHALRQGVMDGTITVLATDHAPHTLEEKAKDFESAPFGIVGLECALALYAKALIDSGLIDWPRLVALLTIEPARLVGLDTVGIGRLAVGGPADITLIDPNLEWEISTDQFVGQGRNCPFDGWKVKGRAITTIVEGTIAQTTRPVPTDT
ncbi:MAG: dihydroorotase [Planctomycetota bacterium]|nr:dihydroorotase [Planctomycetota bacterium]